VVDECVVAINAHHNMYLQACTRPC